MSAGPAASEGYEAGKRAYDNQEFAEARMAWGEAAAAGDGRAQYDLAVMLANGVGLPRDVITAYAWLKIAEENGVAEATALADTLEQDYLPRYCLYDALRLIGEFKRGDSGDILAGGRQKSRCWNYHRNE